MTIVSRLRRSRFAFPLAALAALAILYFSETSYWESRSAMDRLAEKSAGRFRAQRLLRLLVDAETGQRGYLLTGRRDYLEPYERAMAQLPETLEWLKAHYDSQPGQADSMARVDKEVAGKIAELSSTIRMHDEGRDGEWREILSTDIGKRRMDAIRFFTDELVADETKSAARARKDVYDSLAISRIGVGAITALSLLALLLYLRQLHASERQTQDQQQALQFERDRLEAEVARRTSELTMLSRYLMTVREDERNRLARELHDELGALLTTAKLDTARIKRRIGDLSPEASERLAHLNDTLNSGIALKRRIIEDLRPSSLGNLGLAAALEILVREFEQRSDVKCECAIDILRLLPDTELTIYRLVQESLTNISKYAKARNVTVTLASHEGMAEIAVADDGVGFDPALSTASAHGLVGMRYRVEAAGGVFMLRSASGQGTRVAARLPLAPAAPTTTH